MAKNVNVKINGDSKDAVKSVADINKEVKKTETVFKSVKTRLRELQDEMADIGDVNSPQFQKLAKEAGTLKDQMNNANAAIKTMSADFPRLEVGLGVFNALGGATQAVLGSMSALGIENQAVEESIKKLVAVQSIMNGVNSVAQALSDEQILGQKLRIFYQKIQNSLQKKSILSTIKENVVKTALAAKTAVVTASQWAWNVALGANPIGLVVIAITALVAGIVWLSDSIGGIIKMFKDWSLSLLEMIPGFSAIMDAWSFFFGEEAKLIEDSVQANKDRVKELEGEISSLQKVDNERKKSYNREKSQLEQSIAILEAKGKKTDEESKRLIQLNIDEAKAARENVISQIKSIQKLIKLKIKLGDLSQEEVDKLKEQTDALKESLKENSKTIKDGNVELIRIQTQANNDRIAKNKEFQKRLLAAEKRLQKLRINAIKDDSAREIATINSSYDEKLKGLSKNIKVESDLIDAINAERQVKIDAVNEKEIQSQREYLLKLSKLENSIRTKSSEKTFTDREEIIKSSYQNEIDNISLQLKAGKIKQDEADLLLLSAKTDFDNKIVSLNKDKIDTLFEQEQSLMDDKLSLIDIEISQTDDKYNLLIDKENLSYQNSITKLQKNLDDKKITQEQFNSQMEVIEATHQAKLSDIEATEKEKRKQLALDSVNTALDVASKIADIASQLSQIKIDKINGEIESINEAADLETAKRQESLDRGIISKREFDALEEKALKDKNAKELKLRKEAFEIKKKNDLVSAAINTALGITSALAAPFPISIVMGALAAATGIIQISKIKSQQFKAAQGGVVPGSPSGVDSVNSLLAPGEIVINSNSAQLFGPELSAINEAGGGKSLIPNNIGVSSLSKNETVVKAYVVETEITESQKGVNKIENLATF